VEPPDPSISTAKSLKPKPRKRKRHGAVEDSKPTRLSFIPQKIQLPGVLGTSKPAIEVQKLSQNPHDATKIGEGTG
jgi:hypothetical protein